MRAILLMAALMLVAPLATNAEDMANTVATDRGPAVGDKIPSNLASIDESGKARSFENLTGENGLVLIFFRSAKWCPFCKRQLIEIAKDASEITTRGYGLAALSYDSVGTIERYAFEHNPGFTLLSDRQSEVIDAFGIRNEKYGKMHFAHGVPHPMIFVIGPDMLVQAKLAEEGYKERPPISAVTQAIDALHASQE